MQEDLFATSMYSVVTIVNIVFFTKFFLKISERSFIYFESSTSQCGEKNNKHLTRLSTLHDAADLRMILWGFYLVKLGNKRCTFLVILHVYSKSSQPQLHEGSVARCTSITFFLDNMDHFHR